MLEYLVESKAKLMFRIHPKVEKYFLLLGNLNRQVIHRWLFEIIGKNQGVQSDHMPDIEAIETEVGLEQGQHAKSDHMPDIEAIETQVPKVRFQR